MEKRSLVMLILTMLPILSCIRQVQATRQCRNCGRIPVPYPLSTAPGCGDPLYKLSCRGGTLWLDAVNSSSYIITSIYPLTQRLIIRPAGFANNTCMSADFPSQGIQLDSNLPFNITGSNTVVLMNCSELVFQFFPSMNCSSASRCHEYLRENAIAKSACEATADKQRCCWFKTGGSLNEFRIRVRSERCSAYQSFVNLDMDLPVSKWPEPGVELEWMLPFEPVCKTAVDCQDLPNSFCLQDPVSVGQKRCFCRDGFQWDPINGVCQMGRNCKHGGYCNKQTRKTSLIGALAVGAMFLGITTMVVVYRKYSQSRRELAHVSLSKVRERILSVSTSGIVGRIFTSKEITRATNNFSSENLLGSGGFGEVFKGIIDDGTTIAIKRAKTGNTKGIDQILNEVRILCQVNHRCLVKLHGCCVELEHPLLVYEYIPNGTLFDHLHKICSSKREPLTWLRRLVIAHQTAEGLAYLHSSATPPIYHRDIKSSNILLDNELNAKVSDFGLSRLAVTDTSHITTCAQGTLGYLDPEYYLNFQLTDKSDVYSFGVVLLELLTSKKAIDFNRVDEEVNLVIYGRKFLKGEKLLDAVDPFVKEGASKLELETMKALGSLAAACLDEKRQNRPTMKEAADEIEYIISLVTSGVS